MKKILIGTIMLIFIVSILTACSTSEKNIENNKDSIIVTDSDKNKSESSSNQSNIEEIVSKEEKNNTEESLLSEKKDNIDLRKTFMKKNKNKARWRYEGPIETGCILLMNGTETEDDSLNINMRGYFYGGVAFISEGEGTILDFNVKYKVYKDKILFQDKGNDLGGIFNNKIILKTPLELGNKWEENLTYEGKEYAAVSEIIGLEYPEIYGGNENEKIHKGYVVETKIKGLKSKDYAETRIVDIDRGIVKTTWDLIDYENTPFSYQLLMIDDEVPYEASYIEKIKEKYSSVDKINEIYWNDEKISRDGLYSVKKVCLDVDDDGEDETIDLFIKAEVDEKGQLCLDDGNNWCLLFNDGEKEYVLIDEYVQLGTLDFWLIEDMDTHEKTIKVLKAGTAYFNIRDFNINTDKLNGVIWSFYSYKEDGSLNVR